MGLVEESEIPDDIENDEVYEAANANFVNDREHIPYISNPNTLMNSSFCA